MNENENKTINYAQDFGALVALILPMAGISITNLGFHTGTGFLSLLHQSSINELIAFGMTSIILMGAIGLPVGSVLALSAALCAGMIVAGVPTGLAVILALALGCVMDVINGIMVTRGHLQPSIATLIAMTAYRGLTMVCTNDKPIPSLGDNSILKVVRKEKFYGVPIPTIPLIFLFLLFCFLLSRTTFGRRIYATRSSRKSAKLAGASIRRTKIIAYAISGTVVALSDLTPLSRPRSIQPTLGSGYELDAIAVVTPGSTNVNNDRGKIYGTLIGVLIIAVLNNGLSILDVSSYCQDVIKGLIILVAVLSDRKR